MTRTTDIVVTTIFEPAWLEGYLSNIDVHGRREEVTVRIICDRKTPASVYTAAAAARDRGFRVDCPDLDEQAAYQRTLGIDDLIPWNTDNRRNIGFLRAWESGADVLISIDDDNYCRGEVDYVGEHHVVGERARDLENHMGVEDGEWFNICTLLDIEPSAPVYPRGFPYNARGPEHEAMLAPADTVDPDAIVAVNAGLWLVDPDADAITRLALAPRVRAASSTAVLIGASTWTPVNTQNTGLLRAAIPAYYYVRMGYEFARDEDRSLRRHPVRLLPPGLCQAPRAHRPRGFTVVDHRRTPHNLFIDLHQELAGVVLLEDFVPWLKDLPLQGSTYAETYAVLAEQLEVAAPSFRGMVWDEGGREFLVDTARCMRTWLRTIDRIGAA